MASASGSPDASSDLAAYLPRLVLDELADGATDRVAVEGTVLFADLSGFTRLAERLKVEGREGAELLTGIVNDAFESVLDPPLALGGDVVSFGGDSATILFRPIAHAGADVGHAERAVVAAAAMQQVLTTQDAIDTGAGRVRLRMSIGIATGEVVVVPVGEHQRAALLLGPTVDAAVRLESKADATRVWAAPEVVRAVAHAPWRGADVDGSAELRWTRVDADHVVAAATHVSTDASSGPAGGHASEAAQDWIPAALRPQLRGEPSLGELRRTVIGFVRAAPLPELPTHEAAAWTLAGVVERASREHGVCWLASDVCVGGVVFVLTAGSPVATEDDVERMHRALAAVVEDAPLGAVRAGVEYGVVFAGDLGHPRRRYWTVMGDSVNVAARLAADAPPGQVRCGPAVTAASAHGADAELVGRLPVRGRRAPVEVFRVRAATPDHGRLGPATPTRFIGRDHELGVLTDAWDRARAGRGVVVDVSGEAGIGKTRLLAELAAVVEEDPSGDDRRVTWVRSDEFHASVPFAAASGLVREALGIRVDAPPTSAGVALEGIVGERAPHLLPWLPLIADAALARVDPTDAVARLDPPHVAGRREAVVRELLETVRRGPWLVIVDDLQWVDPSSRGLLTAVAASATWSDWLLCVSRRPTTELLVADCELLELGWLGPTQATELAVAAADPTPLTDEQIERVVAAAAGNPLFLEQLAIHATIDDDELPDTIERLIAARIDTLDVGARQLLREVSVVGSGAPLDVVARLLDDAELTGPERWEAMQGFVELVGLALRFRSGLIRAVAHDGLPFARRRALHRGMARIISAMGSVETLDDRTLGQLAWHLLEAGDGGEAWPVAIEAAERARRRGALLEAADLYEQALALHRAHIDADDADIAAVSADHAEVSLDLGRLDAAQASWSAAGRLWTDPIDVARSCSKRAGVELLRGAYGKALRWATKGLGLLEGNDDPAARAMRVGLLVDQAATRLYQGRHRQGLDRAEDALAELADAGIDDPALVGRVHQHLEMAHSTVGDPAADEHGQLAIECFVAVDDQRSLASVLSNMGVTASTQGRWDDAVDRYRRAADATVATGNTTLAAVIQVNQAMLLLRQGEIDDADALALDAGRVLLASGHEVFVGYTEHLRSTVAMWRRDAETATATLAQARARFAAHDAQQMVRDCDVAEVLGMVMEGELDRAARRAAEITAELDAVGDAESLPVTIRRLWSMAELRRGEADRARALANDAVERARTTASPFELALALDALAHAQHGGGEPADPKVLGERDSLLRELGVRRTLFPLAR